MKRQPGRCHFTERLYLVDLELGITSVALLKYLLPGAFEVNGIDQHQLGCAIQHTFSQQILYFSLRIAWTLMSCSVFQMEENISFISRHNTLSLCLHPVVDVESHCFKCTLEVHRLQLAVVSADAFQVLLKTQEHCDEFIPRNETFPLDFEWLM